MPSKRRSFTQRKHEISSQLTSDTTAPAKKSHHCLNTSRAKSASILEVEDFQKIFYENKRKKMIQKTSRKYTYMYSESYQNIERLLGSFGKSLKAKSSSQEFVVLEELTKRKVDKVNKNERGGYEFREPYLTRKFKGKRCRG